MLLDRKSLSLQRFTVLTFLRTADGFLFNSGQVCVGMLPPATSFESLNMF
jgi:hypothetical protein